MKCSDSDGGVSAKERLVEHAGRLPFGTLLRRLRLDAGLSQEMLAERARISTEAVGALERGVRRAPQRETLALIAAGLALEPADVKRLEGAAAASRPARPRSDRVEEATQRPSEPAMHNLPFATSTMHGRDDAISTVAELLQTRRLVTLHGSGGIGKTRLAHEVGHTLSATSAFPGGIWIIDFSPLASGELLAPTVARILGVVETPNESVLANLIAAIAAQRMLLVFDNCEHVIAAAAHLAGLLTARCKSLTIVATSLEPLGAAGEVLFEVAPLELPDRTISVDALRAAPAVQLFLDRARDAVGTFSETIADDDIPTIARICRRLDGIPLALELAAARVRDLSLRDIDAGLDARFTLLSRGHRTAPKRQQTLRGMLDWSYELLTPIEQRIFRGLGIYAGRWNIESASRLLHADQPDLSLDAIRDAVATLVRKSLVQASRNEDGTVRYALLFSARDYARELLSESGEMEHLAAQHAASYRRRAERAAARWRTGAARTPEEAFGPLLADIDELRSVLDWAIHQGYDVALGAELTGLLADAWLEYGFHSEGLERIGAATAAVGGDGFTPLTASLEFSRARLLRDVQRPEALDVARNAATLAASALEPGEDPAWLESFRLRRRFAAGTTIFRQGDEAGELFFIAAGIVQLVEVEVQIGERELLGEMAFFSPLHRRTATAIARTETILLGIGYGEALEMYEADATFRLALLDVFARRLVDDLERPQIFGPPPKTAAPPSV